MDFIKDHLIGMIDAKESGSKGKGSDYSQGKLVVPLARSVLLCGQNCIVKELFHTCIAVGFGLFFWAPLPQRIIRC
jgi:hypothetical protein